ncbi:hypothetical protein ACLB6G_18800 [Zhengella sp. ZM62]|uniref:hypothetical protein n=1 Tax=Zhengella sedimenti TaxID=3390035 RepID=UPI0039768B90
MLERWFGLIEAAFVFGLAVAFYVWQRRDLKREEEKARRKASGDNEVHEDRGGMSGG